MAYPLVVSRPAHLRDGPSYIGNRNVIQSVGKCCVIRYLITITTSFNNIYVHPPTPINITLKPAALIHKLLQYHGTNGHPHHTTPLHSHLLFYLNFKNKRLWLVHLFSLGHMGFIVLCFVVLFMVSVVALFWFFLRGSGFLGCFCSLQKLWLFPSLYLFVLLIYCWFKKKQFKVYMYISKAICWIALFRISKTYLAENS